MTFGIFGVFGKFELNQAVGPPGYPRLLMNSMISSFIWQPLDIETRIICIVMNNKCFHVRVLEGLESILHAVIP